MNTFKIKVIKRNGNTVDFDKGKITLAITKAFLAVEGELAKTSGRIKEIAENISNKITEIFYSRLTESNAIHIEQIQDQVELALMRNGEHKAARAYVIYRDKREKERAANSETTDRRINVKLKNGKTEPLNISRIKKLISESCAGLDDVNQESIFNDTLRGLYDGIELNEVSKALQLTAKTMIEKEPNYSYVAARLLLDEIRADSLSFLGVSGSATHEEMIEFYPEAFKAFVKKGVELELLDERLASFDLDKLASAINKDRDMKFNYLGLQILHDRYFIHSNGIRFELPQIFFMRVAMGLSLNENDKNEKAIEFYNLLSEFRYMCSTPTLFNSGTLRPQLSSCYLTTIPDDLGGIFNSIRDNALMSKYAGGLGNDWTPVRALNSNIKGTNGKSQGVMPFMKVANDTLVAVNQGGKRKGAGCAYLEVWHKDFPEFIEARKNTGDERRRTHDMNTAAWIPDLFMQRVIEDGDWTLFSPNEVPELHDLYGSAFKKAYVECEEKAKNGEIKTFQTMKAVSLWRKMLGMLFETGHPWITFKDACNLRSPQQHVGVVHSSNLCTEITLNTSEDEIAVCNLGSVNLPEHISESGELDIEKLKQTVSIAVRMLDNVIDINYYPVWQAKNANMRHRPVGLGLMGFHDALYKKRIAYSSNRAAEFADNVMEIISQLAINASCELAKQKGKYQSYEGSLWSMDILPIDSVAILDRERSGLLDQDRNTSFDWSETREKIKLYGMRNSNVLAIAPTATIANICGVSQSIDPTYQNLYVKSNMSGEFTVINPYLVNDLKKLGIWDDVMINDLKYYDGSLQQIKRIPEELKQLYATAFEIDPYWLIESASRRQKWIDQGQSLNLYMAAPSGKKLDNLYRSAWYKGLKTTYYLRSMGATNAEKSTISDGALNAVKTTSTTQSNISCSIDNPECEACQ